MYGMLKHIFMFCEALAFVKLFYNKKLLLIESILVI